MIIKTNKKKNFIFFYFICEMTSDAERYLKHLAVFRDSDLKLKKKIIKNCDSGFIDALSEICINYLCGNINCSRSQYKELFKHKNCLRKLAEGNVTRKKNDPRREALLQKGNGFWFALLPVVAELAKYLVKKEI